MDICKVITNHLPKFTEKYKHCFPGDKISVLYDIIRCRTSENGEMLYTCPECGKKEWLSHSCGNRNCPKCQNHLATEWLEKNVNKLLPVDYFLVTFTIPAELKIVAMKNEKLFYSLLFTASSEAMKELASNKKHLGAEIGMTGVLHTNSRRLDYHPHIHYIVPAGGIDTKNKLWKKKNGNYFLPSKPLGTLFRGKLIALMKENELHIPDGLYKNDWVVDIKNTGKGEGTLQYLSRYLYRGVISEKRILSDKNGFVTFTYKEGESGEEKTRTVSGETFLFLLVQHSLPKGFRRCRDYGFLHGNSKKTLAVLQMILNVVVKKISGAKRVYKCSCCGTSMMISLLKVFRNNCDNPIRASPCHL